MRQLAEDTNAIHARTYYSLPLVRDTEICERIEAARGSTGGCWLVMSATAKRAISRCRVFMLQR